MTAPAIATDYLIVGAGATSLAFADSVVTHSTARVLIVDAHDAPGGHWNDAYPFVRLHQPAAYYGVDSLPLGSGAPETGGINAGMDELSSGAEIRGYFERVMRERLLASGRVTYRRRTFAELRGDGTARLRSLVTGDETDVTATTVVDGTLARTEVPSTHPPRYPVAKGVTCVPLNALPTIARPGVRYTVVGSGKTGIDAVLWLLGHGVAQERIRWIMPRDAWMLDRGNLQMAPERFATLIGGITAQLESIAAADSPADLFRRLEAAGQIVRLDPAVEPTAYKCCTVSQPELRELRRVRQVIRMGRVQSVSETEIVLARGRLPLEPGEVLVDCSSCALWPAPPVPVFQDGRINLLMVRTCQPTFSGALIGAIASFEQDTARRDALAKPVPGPAVPIDWLRMWGGTIRNRVAWAQHPGVDGWMRQTRLDPIAIMARTVRPEEQDKVAMLTLLRDTMARAGARIPALLGMVEGAREATLS